VFRDGIRGYMRLHAFSNATTADLWNSLSAASGKDMRANLAAWTEQPGFPLISVASSCDAGGARTLRLSQRRFLLTGSTQGASNWSVPLQVRSGSGTPQSVLLMQDGQELPAGRCTEALNINADASGYYRARYDAATLAIDEQSFDQLPSGDRIVLLDDQWALAESGTEPLSNYLRLVAAMHGAADARAWQQVAGSLDALEFDERGTPGHADFERFARSVAGAVLAQIGWVAAAAESPDQGQLRRLLMADLAEWGDESVIEEARRRFGAFVADRNAISPDDQATMLGIVATYADAATFEQLHAIARSAASEAEMRRFFGALMAVRDPLLAQQAAQIALSDEISPQADSLRMGLVVRIGLAHPELSWSTFTRNAPRLLAPFARYIPLISAQQVPVWYCNGVPMTDIEAWVRAQVPAEMGANIERGLQAARFRLVEKQRLPPEADAFIRTAGMAAAAPPVAAKGRSMPSSAPAMSRS
jgi:aminopeptidase N